MNYQNLYKIGWFSYWLMITGLFVLLLCLFTPDVPKSWYLLPFFISTLGCIGLFVIITIRGSQQIKEKIKLLKMKNQELQEGKSKNYTAAIEPDGDPQN